jgi:hypothetical protein
MEAIMLRAPSQTQLHGSRFHGTLSVSGRSWQVYFVDVARVQSDWLIECMVVGPTVHHVTIHCRPEASHGDTARRVMTALREWLVSGDDRDVAYLEVTGRLRQAS